MSGENRMKYEDLRSECYVLVLYLLHQRWDLGWNWWCLEFRKIHRNPWLSSLACFAKNFPNSDTTFQDDNASCHKSARSQAWKCEHDIPTLNWPSQSPDVNVIENVWRTMKIRLQTRVTYITNRAKFGPHWFQHIFRAFTLQYQRDFVN